MNRGWLRAGVIGVPLGNSPDMQHHSGLSQINTETVSDLGLAWAKVEGE
jgi:hypothetical protein